ncbi:NADH dehydrogenase [ubiquinone] 1 beta subcomplex subunit 7, partial [Neolecta irregularis DAH-3]
MSPPPLRTGFHILNLTLPVSQKEMSDAKIPLAWRDSCAGLLIPLNNCRKKSCYLPWKCENERHSYEKCQYEDFQRRSAEVKKARALQIE